MSEPDRGRRVTARRASAVVVAGLVVGVVVGLGLAIGRRRKRRADDGSI